MRQNTHQSWINQKIRVTQWDNQQTYQQYNLITLHSIFIDKNTKFLELKSLIEMHNKQVKDFKQKRVSINHASLKSQFIAILFIMLSEISQMKNRELQDRYLNEVYRWANQYEFNRKQRPITATTRATRPQTAKTRPFSGISAITTNQARFRYDRNTERQIQQINQQMNKNDSYENILEQKQKSKSKSKININKKCEEIDFEKANQQNFDYANGFRTKHPQYQVPQKRLKQYKRNLIDLEVQEVLDITEPKPSRIRYQKKKVYVPQPEIQQNLQNVQNIEGMQQQPAEGEAIAEGDQNNQVAQVEINIPQQQKVEQEIELQIEPPKDKLRPRIKSYTQNVVPIQHLNLIKYQRKLQLNQNKVQMQKKDQQEMVKVSENWAISKARWQKQESRKKQSIRVIPRPLNNNLIKAETQRLNSANFIKAEVITEIGKKKKFDQNPNFLRYEETLNQNNLKKTLQNHLQNISYKVSKDIQIIPPNSKFDRTKCISAHSVSSTKPKKFSEILHQAKQLVQNETDKQILQIKQTLAKHKVVVDMPKIRSAISNIDIKVDEQEYSKQIFNLVGKQLPNNPFFKISKKKKKKKKKKK